MLVLKGFRDRTEFAERTVGLRLTSSEKRWLGTQAAAFRRLKKFEPAKKLFETCLSTPTRVQ